MRTMVKNHVINIILIILLFSLICYQTIYIGPINASQKIHDNNNDIVVLFNTHPLHFSSKGNLTNYNVNATNQTITSSAITIFNNGTDPITIQLKINTSIDEHIHLKWNTTFTSPIYQPYESGQEITTKIYADEADGYAKYLGSSNQPWSSVHDALYGNQWNNTTAWYDKGIYGLYAAKEYRYVISRAFFPFETSDVPDNTTIKKASLFLTGRDIGSANTSICIVNWTGGEDGVYIDDFSQIGQDLLSNNISWNVTRYNNISLNHMGKTIINKTGFSYFCAQEYNHDYLNITPTQDLRNSICFQERNNVYDEDPYLWITYANDTAYRCDKQIDTTYSIITQYLNVSDQLHIYLWADFDNTTTMSVINRDINISVNNLGTNDTSYYTNPILIQPWVNYPPQIDPNTNATPEHSSSGVSLSPTCSVWVEDSNGHGLNCSVYSSFNAINWSYEKNFENINNDTISWQYNQANGYAATYYWKITASDGYFTNSKIFSFTTTADPQPPLNFSATSHTINSINLTWNNSIRSDKIHLVRNASGYPHYPISQTNGSITIVDSSDVFYYDMNLTANITYYYSAWGYNSSTHEYSTDVSYTNATVETIDINQSVHDRGFPIRHASDGDWAGAQNFIPTIPILKHVKIYLRKFGIPEFNLTVELREGGIEGTIIDSITFTPAEIPTTWTWFEIDFNDTVVLPSTQYYIVCPPAPSGVTTSFGYEWGYAFGDQYADGAFWFTRDGGNLWRDLPSMYEFTFKIYGIYN